MTTDERLRVDVLSAPDRVVLALQGELDLAAAPQLAAEIERAETGTLDALVLDLSRLEFIDSAGLRVLLAAHERARESGRAFAITPGPAQVQRLLEIAGVGDHLVTIARADAGLGGDAGERGLLGT
ncbi:MAG TPA: STAS domain-containing protein [Solirubrobacteraceae bacterium]|jgi:anti-anti-sigma factor|nr:STAS domain-containing protein [Solirubrobacteraceae bacterium]